VYVTGTLFLAALIALAGAGCLVVALSWNRRSQPIWQTRQDGLPSDSQKHTDGDDIDVEKEIRDAVAGVAAATRHKARVVIAVRPGLTVRVDPFPLRSLLRDLILCAIRDPTCAKALVSALLQPGGLRIVVSDDGTVAATSTREGQLRHASQLVAMQGGSMQIDVHPGEGTTVAVRLPLSPVTTSMDQPPMEHAVVQEKRRYAERPPAESVVRAQAVQAGDFQREL
jgi:hypothetical protein